MVPKIFVIKNVISTGSVLNNYGAVGFLKFHRHTPVNRAY